jgi:hypothetical protein
MSTKVIVTNFRRLKQKCGKRFDEVDDALNRLIQKDKQRGITTSVIQLDDAAQMKQLKAPPVKNRKSPKQNKDAIDGVYRTLQPEFILILGAIDVVPHQDMKNPKYSLFNDPDEFAYGDLPYASEAQYGKDPASFRAPTRVVGRLPDLATDGAKGDASLNVDYLKKILGVASDYASRKAGDYEAYMGISAWQWRESTQLSIKNVFGSSSDLQLSPPDGPDWQQHFGRQSHFINCHGAQADTRFYGQKANSFPVALDAKYVGANTAAGTVIAAECCYGAELFDPSKSQGQQGICSTYLDYGAYAFFGSTTIAYGPAAGNGGADLICQYFLKHVLAGASIGRAALEARHEFVQAASSNSAGALNPVDLKTLAQFYLLGDPSLHPVEAPVTHSTATDLTLMKTLSAGVTDFSAKRQLQRRQLIRKGLALGGSVAYASRSERVAPSGEVQNALQQLAKKLKLRGAEVQSFEIKGAALPKAAFRARLAPPVFHVVEGQTGPKKTRIPTSVAIVVQEQAGKIISIQDYHRR